MIPALAPHVFIYVGSILAILPAWARRGVGDRLENSRRKRIWIVAAVVSHPLCQFSVVPTLFEKLLCLCNSSCALHRGW